MYEEQVARGAAWLDEHRPGWETRIDPANLEMSECARCVIGQTFGLYELVDSEAFSGYTFIIREGGILDDEYGFNLPDKWNPADDEDRSSHIYCEGTGEECPHWAGLRDAWIAQVKRRLDEGISV